MTPSPLARPFHGVADVHIGKRSFDIDAVPEPKDRRFVRDQVYRVLRVGILDPLLLESPGQ